MVKLKDHEPKKMMRVLIAENNPVALRFLERNIKKWDYEVIATRNGQEAWKAIKEDDLRLIILDWVMPEMNGIELCQKIRQQKKSKYIYILLLTSRDRQQDIIEGLSAGADDYMVKPPNLLELRARLQKGKRIIELEDSLLETHKKLIELASRDSLTHLWNRATILKFLEEELEQSSRENYPASVIMVDVDNFKKINDTFGHCVGDIVLTRVASRLKKNVRLYDQVGRYGGDEMFIILPNCGLEAIGPIAERLCLSISQRKIKTSGGFLAVTITLGCASTESFSEPSVDGLIQASDKALYKGKNQGRNRVSVAKLPRILFKRQKNEQKSLFQNF